MEAALCRTEKLRQIRNGRPPVLSVGEDVSEDVEGMIGFTLQKSLSLRSLPDAEADVITIPSGTSILWAGVDGTDFMFGRRRHVE